MPDTAIAAPPAPAAPKPSPAPPPTKPAPPAAPTPPPASPKPTAEADTFAELDRALSPKRKEEPSATDTPKEITEDEENQEDLDAEAAESKSGDSAPKSKDDRTIDTPKARRAKLEQAIAEAKAAKDALAEREAKIAEFEGRSKESTALAERLAAIEKERDEAKAEARGLRQEMSPEFHEKYEAPYDAACNQAQQFVETLTVDNGDGTTRKASWERDFAAIYNLPEVEAAERAEQMFGKHADRVMRRYERLHDLSATRDAAKAHERANWQKTETERQANAVREREAATAMYTHVEKDLREKNSDWFGEKPDDPEENAIVKSHSEKLMEKPKSMQEHVIRQARVKLYAENFPRVAYRLKKALERISELEAKGESASASEPGKTRRSSSVEAPKPKTFEEGLRSLARG